MTTENSKGRKDVGTSNISHVSREPLECIHVTTPYIGHIVKVTFRSSYNTYDLFSNITRLSSSLLNSVENNVIFVSIEEMNMSHEYENKHFLVKFLTKFMYIGHRLRFELD